MNDRVLTLCYSLFVVSFASLFVSPYLDDIKGWFENVPRQFLNHYSVSALSGEQDRTLKLSKCLDSFVEEEKISEAYCSKCKEHGEANLKTEFWRLPPVLVVSVFHMIL